MNSDQRTGMYRQIAKRVIEELVKYDNEHKNPYYNRYFAHYLNESEQGTDALAQALENVLGDTLEPAPQLTYREAFLLP